MYCNICGKEIPDNSKFCRFCGYSLVDYQNINKVINNSVDINNSKFNIYISILTIVEVLLWIGFGIILLNFVPYFNPSTLEKDLVSLPSIFYNIVALIITIGYIKGWYNNFGWPLVICIYFIIANISIPSIVDVLLYSIGIIGVLIKYDFINKQKNISVQ